MEDKIKKYVWITLKSLTVQTELLTELTQHKYTLSSSSIEIDIRGDIDFNLTWKQYLNGIYTGDVDITIFDGGGATMTISRNDRDNLIYVQRLVKETEPDLFSFSLNNRNLDQEIHNFYTRLNLFFKIELSDYLSGEKWIDMEVDWGDYK